MAETAPTAAAAPRIERVRHELKIRDLGVVAVERITPAMIRVTLGGEPLADLQTASPDDHVKIALPDGAGDVLRREYTVRAFDREARRLVLDFVDHEGGPATEWARGAAPGMRLEVGGPRGSQIVTGEIERWLLVGDETALPAIQRRVEELPAGCRATVLVAVAGPDEENPAESAAEVTWHWHHRPLDRAHEPAPLIAALRGIDTTADFAWIAAEARVARAVRTHLIEERGHDKTRLKSAGYWTIGKADAADKTLDSED